MPCRTGLKETLEERRVRRELDRVTSYLCGVLRWSEDNLGTRRTHHIIDEVEQETEGIGHFELRNWWKRHKEHT